VRTGVGRVSAIDGVFDKALCDTPLSQPDVSRLSGHPPRTQVAQQQQPKP